MQTTTSCRTDTLPTRIPDPGAGLRRAPTAPGASAVRTDALDSAREAWRDLGYGMFIHFGMNTFDGKGWGDGQSPAARFNPEQLDCNQWADLAAEAGMKYAVLTTKHHDGFCLWPTRHTDYCVRNAGCTTDVVGAFVDAFRRAGIQTGLYYSLWDTNCPFYEDDARYAQFMRDQIAELLTNYGPVVELWFDGAWDKDHPTRKWQFDPAWHETVDRDVLHGSRWQWKQLYQHIHQLQPTCLVVNNTSSDRPGRIRYLPVDLRTAEHYDFVHNGVVHHAVTDDRVFDESDGTEVELPLEYCTTLNPDWFWIRNKHYSHPSAETIADWRRRARATRANLLLNVGPTTDGLIPEYHRAYLRDAERALSAQP